MLCELVEKMGVKDTCTIKVTNNIIKLVLLCGISDLHGLGIR